jgi:hypothetical protein
MKKPITNIELIESQVGRWKPSDVAFIRELRFCGMKKGTDEELISPTLELIVLIQPRPLKSVGWPDPSGKFWEASLKFEGVQKFRVNQNGAADLQVAGFDIEDHSESQMENIRLHVFDYEFDSIDFWAHSAKIISCTPSTLRPHATPLSREYPIDYEE